MPKFELSESLFVYYEDFVPCEPITKDTITLLLIHGYGHSAHEWDGYPQLMDPRWRIITPDLLSMGRSGDVTPGRWSDEDIVNAEVLHALMKHLNVEKYFVAGHSFGGRVTGMIAAMYPEEVLGGCLITNVPFNFPPLPPGQPSMIQVGAMMAVTPEGFRTFQGLCDVPPGKPPRNPQILRFLNEEGEKYWRRSTYDPNALEREKSMLKDRSEYAKKITCPLLFITADEDFFVSLTLQERVTYFPNSALHCFSGMGHMFPLIDVAGTAGVLSRWISRNLPSPTAGDTSKVPASPTDSPAAPPAPPEAQA